MFARQVDPFKEYNSALSAAEKRHRDMVRHQDMVEEELQHRPLDQPSCKKRPLHFEPDFVAALDSSLLDSPTLSRPCKKTRRSAFGTTPPSTPALGSFPTMPTTNPTSTTPAPPTQRPTSTTPPKSKPLSIKASEGPCIIDLASGEELVALHLGENEHKRRRDSTLDMTTEPLREVYDVQEDGSLCSVMDHAPALPSPAKKSRLSRPKNGLRFLVDEEHEQENKDMRKKHKRPTRYSSTASPKVILAKSTVQDQEQVVSSDSYRDQNQDMDQDGWMSDDEAMDKQDATHANLMALIPYQGPKTVSIAKGIHSLLKSRLDDEHDTFLPLDGLQGHEMVLYRPTRPSFISAHDDESNHTSTRIVELNSDEDDFADDEGNGDRSREDNPLLELEEKIMDMELD